MSGMKPGPGDDPFDEDTDADESADQTDDEDAVNEVSERDEMSAMNAMSEDSAVSAWNVKNVKSEWKGKTVYLPEHLEARLNDEYDRLVYELDREIKKDRHYKPLLIALALDRLEGMERDDITSFMERMEDEDLGIKD